MLYIRAGRIIPNDRPTQAMLDTTFCFIRMMY
jgi:hypothetical protein